jgi:dTMP kinase
MRINEQKPLFIVVDGGDGSGKDTQAKYIAQYLKKAGYSQIRIRSHPALDNRYGRIAKNALEIGGKKGHLISAFFFTIDVIRSLVKYYRHENEVLIFSRYLLGVCYLPNSLILFGYNFFSRILPNSDFLFFIDVPPNIARARILKRGSTEEMFESLSRLTKIRSRMVYITNYKHWHYINGDCKPQEVWFQIKQVLTRE